jgi:hypothetical protein
MHIAITRRVRPGREAEFERALHEFFRASFARDGVLGASMLAPPPGSDTREFGILRTFADEQEREAFYASPLFAAWEKRAQELTEGEAVHRELHGLEAFFRSPRGSPPPRWKMAVATLLGVFPTSLALGAIVPPFTRGWSMLAASLVFTALMVALLTWVVMPLVTRLLHRWLHRDTRKP